MKQKRLTLSLIARTTVVCTCTRVAFVCDQITRSCRRSCILIGSDRPRSITWGSGFPFWHRFIFLTTRWVFFRYLTTFKLDKSPRQAQFSCPTLLSSKEVQWQWSREAPPPLVLGKKRKTSQQDEKPAGQDKPSPPPPLPPQLNVCIRYWQLGNESEICKRSVIRIFLSSLE